MPKTAPLAASVRRNEPLLIPIEDLPAVQINSPTYSALTATQTAAPKPPAAGGKDDQELRQAFDQFVGQTLFGQMLQSMRKTVGKPAYFDGGRAEEIFTQQLDQVLSEKIASASADTLTGPMFELFTTPRR